MQHQGIGCPLLISINIDVFDQETEKRRKNDQTGTQVRIVYTIVPYHVGAIVYALILFFKILLLFCLYFLRNTILFSWAYIVYRYRSFGSVIGVHQRLKR